MMNCILWNCRGANKPNFRRSIRYILKKNPTDLLAIFETHAGGDRSERICRGLGFDNSFRVDAEGQSGGLWLLWRSGIGIVTVISSTNQFIQAMMANGDEVLNLIVVYAAPTVSRRSGLWDQLRDIIGGVTGPVIVGEDFNTIVRLDERSGGNGSLSADSMEFGQWINDLSLIDMGFRGHAFTWKRGREECFFVTKRLYRVLCCAQSRLRWQEATVTHLPFLASDHAPLYLQLAPVSRGDASRRPFRFEAAWLKHDTFKDLLEASWNTSLSTPEALEILRTRLRRWNREVFGEVQRRKETLVSEIKKVQDLILLTPTDDLLMEEVSLSKELDLTLEQEEVIWFQKSREKWIPLGDRNTSFFHTSTIIRRRRNRIEMLKKDDGSWVTNAPELENLAVEYYRRLYSMVDVDEVVPPLPREGFALLSQADHIHLDRPFTAAEVEKAVRDIGKYKAPGPDGFQPVFYQHCWDVVGDSVVRFILEFFRTGVLPPNTNDVLIVLLEKVAKPKIITQFRPISLCNVLFKTITKVMVVRLKRVITKLIGPAQASFIPGRLNTDNIVMVQEAVHSMRRKKGRRGWMLLKLDLEKAYDRIRWDFLEDTLIAAGLSEQWVGWIMRVVSGPSMNLLFNGEKTEAFRPSRGLRQGDPISPYLFVLCMERLCHLIGNSIAEKCWKPIKLSRGGPELSHVCFADDLILFAEASVAQVRTIRNVLETFCLLSGQKVSLEKSKIFFSSNVSRELGREISDASGISSTCDLGKYLGMHVLQKRMNKETFSAVVERVSARLAGWKSHVLSLAGRITLTKSVLSSIPVHSVSSVLLPRSTLATLDKVSRSFVWGSTADKRKQHLISWSRVCVPKEEGGLGIRNSLHMNTSLIAKVGWRLMNDEKSLWARVVRCKYRVGDSHDLSWLRVRSNWSVVWRSIVTGLKEAVLPGQRWVVGDGSTIRFWTDKWLSGVSLSEKATSALPANYEGFVAKDLWIPGRGWRFDQILPYVSENTGLELWSIVVDCVTGAKDRLSWGGSAEGKFTVKSAYSLLTLNESPRQNMEQFWKRVWRVKAPERVRVFLWLVCKQAIMTNVERKRRHLCDSDVCSVCCGGFETILHVLRDCPAMAGIWQRIVPARERSEFFSQSLLVWLFQNLKEETSMNGVPWATQFAMGVWWGWKWRCGNVFGENRRCPDRVKFIKDLAKEVWMAHLATPELSRSTAREERLIGWSPPEGDWIKLNTDGASRGNPGSAAAGGVLRDAEGQWCGGFAINIGRCSAPLAELWGVYYGLCMAWEK
ncbi:unnamed protein product [Microthlaspi erraticum]|uniref:Uncharacterized protein n=1 Tax=Microthlaspi erraticum TaxID=1685480 RepID=A0A6D2HR93_9BRAS|nr:unnamed protein product [Microthlaspi erraticum]